MNKYLECITILIISIFSVQSVNAAIVKVLKTQKKVFYTEQSNGLYKALSLKTKVYIFTEKDTLKCGTTLRRGLKTLSYFCTIDFPDSSKIKKLHLMESHNIVNVKHGRLKKKIYIKVDPNGKSVKFSTEFDNTGIDWDVSKFNDEFYSVYAKSAQSILAKAMLQKGLKIQTIDQ